MVGHMGAEMVQFIFGAEIAEGAGKLPQIARVGGGARDIEKALPRSGPILQTVGAASHSEMLACRLKLNINNLSTRQVLNSLDDTASDQGGSYFTTFAVVSQVSVFTRQQYRSMLVESLQYCQLCYPS